MRITFLIYPTSDQPCFGIRIYRQEMSLQRQCQGMSIRAEHNLRTIQYDTYLQVFSKRYRGSNNFYGMEGKPTLQTVELSDKSQPESTDERNFKRNVHARSSVPNWINQPFLSPSHGIWEF